MKKILFSVVVVAMLWSCGKDDSPSTPPASAPTIIGFTPKMGPVGTEVTITGTNFSTTKTDNTVKFGGTAAMVNTVTSTQLKVAVPTGATTGKISVTVDGETATSTADFVVTAVVPENSAPEMADQEFKPLESITDADEIGQVTATDPDGDTLTFSITDSELFVISDAGMITLAEGKTLDFETETTHNITVSVTDGEKSVEATITINVENVIDTMAEDPASFVTTWKTEADGEEIIIGAFSDYDYDFQIDWGDGTIEDILKDSPQGFSHTYELAGTYTVAIKGIFPAIKSYQQNNTIATYEKLMSIEQWGSTEWKTFKFAFHYCENMVYNATDAPDLTNVKSTAFMFRSADLFNGDIGDWDMSNVEDMNNMFAYTLNFNGDISSWDTSSAINMLNMFLYAEAFNADISGWNTSNVTNMQGMLYRAKSFDQDLGGWDIGNVQNMTGMLGYSGMSKENLNSTLIGWSNFVTDTGGPENIILGIDELSFCGQEAINAVNNLEGSHMWDINGDFTFDVICN